MPRFGAAEGNLSRGPTLASSQKTAVGVTLPSSSRFAGPAIGCTRDLPWRLHGPDHDRFAVGRPECAIEIPVEGSSSDIAAVAFHPIHDEDILIVALPPSQDRDSDVFTVRRGDWKRRELRMRRDGSDFAVAEVQNCGEELMRSPEYVFSLAHKISFLPSQRVISDAGAQEEPPPARTTFPKFSRWPHRRPQVPARDASQSLFLSRTAVAYFKRIVQTDLPRSSWKLHPGLRRRVPIHPFPRELLN